jgi:predicted Fe-S protein YdhL (DUF1289 family)
MKELIQKVDQHKVNQEQDLKEKDSLMNNNINNHKIISPCISICKTDPKTGYCYGCARTNQEKILWKSDKTDDNWKKGNLNLLIQRMSGWQLETFKESYLNKIKTGFSLYKESLIKNNNEK